MSDEGDEPLPRPKRNIKKAIVSSASSSDSDDSSPTITTRKKRLRVLSEDGSDSSSGSWAMGAVRRRRTLPGLRDSEGDSDSSDWATDQSDMPHTSTDIVASTSVSKSPNKIKTVSGFSSDSSEGNSEKCSICLMKFLNQEVGIPQNCEHIFCLDCITEWSRNMNTCPVDRITFDSIVVRACAGGRVLRTEAVQVLERRPSLEMMIIEDPTVCEVCQNADREESMLLCDGCDLGFHMQCLTPPLTRIPEDQWLCPNCSGVWRSSPVTVPGSSPAQLGVGGGGRAARAPRAGPSAPRARRAAPAPRARRGTAPARERAAPARKRRTKRRKTVRTAARRSHVRASVRARLVAAQEAGPAPAPAGALASRRARAGIPALSLFGSEHQLDYFEEDEADQRGASTTATAVAVRPSSGILSAYRQARRKMFRIPSPPTASAAPDLLSDILESQTLLHSRRSVVSVTVAADGSLDIQLQPRRKEGRKGELARGGERVRQAPAYPGQGRGWGGGYRYPRDHGNPQQNYNQGNQNYGRGGPDNGFNGPPRAPHERREDSRAPLLHDYGRRPFPADDEPWHERHRRLSDQNRGPNGQRNDERRFSGGGGWRGGRAPGGFPSGPQPRPPPRAPPAGPEDPLDMRVGPQPGPAPDAEDERNDEGLVIDTEKYDPTEPTLDDDSGEEASPAAPAPPALAAPAMETILAELGPRALAVPAAVLDSAVRAALQEHRALAAAPGDCPNFSIYSATSVHIASESGAATPAPPPPARRDSLEDLVQEDGGATPPPAPPEERTLQEYKAKVSKRCPITTNTRNPIKIKLNAPSLIKRQVSLYDDEDVAPEPADEPAAPPPAPPPPAPAALPAPGEPADEAELEAEADPPEIERKSPGGQKDETEVPAPSEAEEPEEAENEAGSPRASADEATPERSTEPQPDLAGGADENIFEDGRTEDELEPDGKDKGRSDSEDSASSGSGRLPARAPKMTESISETEDERSYTPCLDENKSKDASLEDRGLEGLDTEMISEEEGNDMFSEGSPPPPGAAPEDGEICDRRAKPDDAKRKKRKDGKKDRDRAKARKRPEVVFKKGGKAKERNYRERDKEKEKRRSRSSSRRRKDKRKDLERYDVRTLVSERRRRPKDAFGRDVSPEPARRPDADPPRRRGSASPRRRISASPRRRISASPRKRISASPRRRISASPRRRTSASPRRRISASPRRRISASPRRRVSTSPRRRISASPRRRISVSPRRRISASPRRRISASPRRRISASPRRRISASPRRRISASPKRRISASPRRRISSSPRRRPSPSASPAGSLRRSPSPKRRRKRSGSPPKPPRRRRSGSRARKRRRSASAAGSPKPAKAKKKKRARSARAGSKARSPRRRSPRRKRARRRSAAAPAWPAPAPEPCTPPAAPAPEERRRRRDLRRLREPAGPSKEVFTSGDNILVSVSFKEQEGAARGGRRGGRRRRAAPAAAAKPVAIIDLERSPFRELTPSPKNVIVLSDDEERAPAAPAPAEPAAGPKTPPEPAQPAPPPAATPPDAEARGPLTPPEPPDSPDAYDPYEPTRSASGSASGSPRAAPAPEPAPDPAPPSMTLEAAQKTNLSADEVLDRRPLSPIEKVMALLQSTRDVSPEEPHARSPSAPGPPSPGAAPPAAPGAPGPPAPPAPRVLLPEAPRPTPKLFLAKPSPIKSDPIKPMPQATKISRLPLPVAGAGGASPYSPGSSDFGDLFSPPRRDAFEALQERPRRAKRNGKPNKRSKKSKTVDVKLDEDNLKILDELPSSAVEMQVKSKFLKKLNRQERVVEEVKLVLKPHYNKKHVSKDEYKHILRRAVPKICHNKTGEINPMKIQALVEAYVKKFRKKRKLGQ